MKAVKNGGNRQNLHEKLRAFAKKPLSVLIDEIAKDPEFHLNKKEIKPLLSISSLIGRAPEQVRDFLKDEVYPFLKKWKRPVKLPPVEI